MKKRTKDKPAECQLCHAKITKQFVDGATRPRGQWADMCLACHRAYGYGLGIGKGQYYELNPATGKFEEQPNPNFLSNPLTTYSVFRRRNRRGGAWERVSHHAYPLSQARVQFQDQLLNGTSEGYEMSLRRADPMPLATFQLLPLINRK